MDIGLGEHSTQAYDEIIARRQNRRALIADDELMEELTGADVPYTDALGPKMRGFLAFAAIVLFIFCACCVYGNWIAGFCICGFALLLWCGMVEGGVEIEASAGGAGNMFRDQRVGRSSEWSRQREERVAVVETIVENVPPDDLLANLENPSYVRTLREALRRDEQGWTMSD
jgi:hypothetical protein